MKKSGEEKSAGEKVTLRNLTAPIKIGSFELKNRMVLAPINETTSGATGGYGQCIAYYGGAPKAAAGDHGCHHGDKIGSSSSGDAILLLPSGYQQALSLPQIGFIISEAWPPR
jgi:hypothetical protein